MFFNQRKAASATLSCAFGTAVHAVPYSRGWALADAVGAPCRLLHECL